MATLLSNFRWNGSFPEVSNNKKKKKKSLPNIIATFHEHIFAFNVTALRHATRIYQQYPNVNTVSRGIMSIA